MGQENQQISLSSTKREKKKKKTIRKGDHLLLLAGEMPDTPAHVLESGASLACIPSGNDLDPCPMKISLIDSGNHLLHEILRRIEMAALPQRDGRGLTVINGGGSTVENGLQVSVYPLVSRHSGTQIPIKQLRKLT